MKKSILNLGKSLVKEKQMKINGGKRECRSWDGGCYLTGAICIEPDCKLA